jgi:hypothetical protein
VYSSSEPTPVDLCSLLDEISFILGLIIAGLTSFLEQLTSVNLSSESIQQNILLEKFIYL